MRNRLRFLVLGLLVPMLFACQTPPPAPLPQLTFQHKQQIRLAVESIEIINEYRPTFESPHIEHLMPVAPGPAAERWAQDVLRATGGTDKAVFVITDASATEAKLRVQKGIQGAFTVDQSERYDARLSVRLEVRTQENRRRAVTEVFAERSSTIAENASPNARAELWYKLVEDLMEAFDRSMRPNVSTHLGQYAR